MNTWDGGGTVPLAFIVKFDRNFTNDLYDATSDTYLKTAEDLKNELTEGFKDLPDFDGLKIVALLPGSVICNFNVTLRVTKQLYDPKIIENKLNISKDILKNVSKINTEYLEQNFQTQVKQAVQALQLINSDPCSLSNVCQRGQFCQYNVSARSVQCLSLCANYTCPENADCFINDFYLPQCRCKSTAKYVYSGEDCGVAVEKLKLGANEIIAIAVSIGLAAIILTVIIVLAIVYRRRKQNKRSTDSSEDDNIVTSAFASPQATSAGPGPMQLALSGRFASSFRLPRVHSDRSENRDLPYQESIYPPDAEFPYTGSDVMQRRPTSEGQRSFGNIRLRDSQFSQGLPTAYNPRTAWTGRSSYWSDDEQNA